MYLYLETISLDNLLERSLAIVSRLRNQKATNPEYILFEAKLISGGCKTGKTLLPVCY